MGGVEIDIINNIIQLPTMFHSRGDISMYTLLKESGYFENYDQITESDITAELLRFPVYINSWLNWSDDKRSASGWFFNLNKNGKYLVGCAIDVDHYIAVFDAEVGTFLTLAKGGPNPIIDIEFVSNTVKFVSKFHFVGICYCRCKELYLLEFRRC